MKTGNKTIIILITIILLFTTFHVLFHTTKHHTIHWDEAVYISMGKYLWSIGSQGLFESIRPIGLPLLLGLLWKFGGTTTTYHVLIALFGIGILVLTYIIAKELSNKEAALWTTLLLATTPFFVQSSFNILTEIPTTFFVMLTIWTMIKKIHPTTIGCLLGIVFLFKFPAGLLLIAAYLIVTIETPRKVLTKRSPVVYISAGFILIIVPFLILNYALYRPFTSSMFDALFRPLLLGTAHANNIAHSISGTLDNLFYYPLEIAINNPFLLFGLIGIIPFIWNQRKKAHYIFIPLLLLLTYFTIITNKQLRFAVLFLPFIALLAGVGLQTIIHKIHQGTRTRKILLIITVLLIGAYLVYPQFVTTYRFYPSEETNIEQEYYTFFTDKVPTTILTTEPYFTAYTDNLLAIPYYNNATDAYELYDRYKGDVDYIVFNNDFFPCNNNVACEITIATLEMDIIATNELIYEEEWSESMKQIYATKE